MKFPVRDDLDVAVVGVAGRFPGAANCDEYWRNLLSGVDAVSRFDRSDLLAAGHDRAKIDDPSFVPANGVLQGAEHFDAEFFNFSPAEAALLDPQARLMLECVWLAMENAGLDLDRRGRDVGLFLGARSTVQWTMQSMLSDHVQNVGGFLASQLANKDALSTLVSWKLGLNGPSFTVQTACSTSLVSVHLAVQSLLSGECEWAVAGGVSLLLPQTNGHQYREGMLFSQDGATRAFDAEASGSVFGSGLGAVVLRRAADALRDGDPIWALIKGSAINNDGNRKVGYTAPSTKGQADVIRTALRLAEVEPDEIDFIECHGTATRLGDSIEIAALRDVFRTAADAPNQCALGAVKGNIGHLDSAAGIAGLIKAVLAVRHGMVPPTLHFVRPNPDLRLESTPFYVNAHAMPWPERADRPRLAGVSSFGVGGTNAHVVLQQYPVARDPAAADGGHLQFLPFSAKDETALRDHLKAVRDWLVLQPDLDIGALAIMLTRRHGHRQRAVFAAHAPLGLIRAIDRYLDDAGGDCVALLDDALQGEPQSTHIVALAEAVDWLGGAAAVPGQRPRERESCHAPLDIPGYVFRKQDHGIPHVGDAAWERIGRCLAPSAAIVSRDAPGWLAPYWRPIRRPVDDIDSGAHCVVLTDRVGAPWLDLTGQEGLETVTLDIGDPKQLAAALDDVRRATAGHTAPVILSIVLPLGFAGFEPFALQRLTGLSQGLAAGLLSDIPDVHLYLVCPIASPGHDGKVDAGDLLTSAAMKALALVLPQEVPGISCTFVGIHGPAGYWTRAAITPVLRMRVDGPLRLDREGLFATDFRSLSDDGAANRAALPTNGTVVITGASGRMAQAMAHTLAKRGGVRLALISRQPAESPRMTALRGALEASGAARVAVFPAALDDEDHALTLFERIAEEMGPIDTVLHTAGLVDGPSFAPLNTLRAEDYAAQLQPKAHAATVLAAVFEKVPVGQCIVTSSMSAFFGGIAHAAYATANLFLDEWCRAVNMRWSGTRWLCINWDTVHFHEDTTAAQPLAWGRDERALAGADFPPLFAQSLGEFADEPHKICSAGGFMHRLQTWGGQRSGAAGVIAPAQRTGPARERSAKLASAYVAPREPLEQELADIWTAILGIQGIGVHDSFLEMGGDSLKSVVMAERVYKQLGRRFPLQEFVADPTIAGIARLTAATGRAPEPAPPAIDPAAPIEASTDQELIHIHQQAFQDASYNMPTAFRCRDTVGIDEIVRALQGIVDRHVALRCLFARDGDRLLMHPQADAIVPVDRREPALPNDVSERLMRQFAELPFDLGDELPIRALVIPSLQPGGWHQIVIVVHHVVCDAVSLGILTAEFGALASGRSLPEVVAGFGQIRLARRHAATDEAVRRHQSYWRANLLPLPPPLALRGEESGTVASSRTGGPGFAVAWRLDGETATGIHGLCEELGVPPFIFFLGLYGLWLGGVGRCEAILLGVPITGRTCVEEAAVVGYLVNLVAFKVELDPDIGFAELLLALQNRWTDGAPHQVYPISALLDDLRNEPYCRNRRGRHPLFDAVFNFLPGELTGGGTVLEGAGFQPIALPPPPAKFDVTLEVAEGGEDFECLIQLGEGTVLVAGVDRVERQFRDLLAAILAEPDAPIRETVGGIAVDREAAGDAASEVDVDLEFNM